MSTGDEKPARPASAAPGREPTRRLPPQDVKGEPLGRWPPPPKDLPNYPWGEDPLRPAPPDPKSTNDKPVNRYVARAESAVLCPPPHHDGSIIAPPSSRFNVFIKKSICARRGDPISCKSPQRPTTAGIISTGLASVLVHGRPIARSFDKISHLEGYLFEGKIDVVAGPPMAAEDLIDLALDYLKRTPYALTPEGKAAISALEEANAQGKVSLSPLSGSGVGADGSVEVGLSDSSPRDLADRLKRSGEALAKRGQKI